MSQLLVVGSVALDSVETPEASRMDVIGGSAVFCSYAASYFTQVNLVGVVGEDWPEPYRELLAHRRIDLRGLKTEPGKETFRWHGRYKPNMNDRETLEVQLNVFGEFDPIVPEAYRNARFVFLANAVPVVQQKVLSQVHDPYFVMADTMDLWIVEHRHELMKVLAKIHGLVLNDSEARLLTGDENLVRSGRAVLKMGPRIVIIKKGEHGSLLFTADETFALPAYPTERIVDPTGAGDSFAGGMMGYLTEQGDASPRQLHRAMAYGTIVASYNVEDFSLDRMRQIERPQIESRMEHFREMLTM